MTRKQLYIFLSARLTERTLDTFSIDKVRELFELSVLFIRNLALLAFPKKGQDLFRYNRLCLLLLYAISPLTNLKVNFLQEW